MFDALDAIDEPRLQLSCEDQRASQGAAKLREIDAEDPLADFEADEQMSSELKWSLDRYLLPVKISLREAAVQRGIERYRGMAQ